MSLYEGVIFDGFSGLDGWSLGFPDEWLIVSVELNGNLPFPPVRPNQIRIISDLLDPGLPNMLRGILDEHEFKTFDLMVFSPPCAGFSIASCSTHWTPPPERRPKSDTARLAVKLVKRSLDLVLQFQPCAWVIENPRGLLRKMPFMEGWEPCRRTVWQCSYGDDRAKPTDLWSDLFRDGTWRLKPECHNFRYDSAGAVIRRHCHHEGARRGAKTGTQGRAGAPDRSLIPIGLSRALWWAVAARCWRPQPHPPGGGSLADWGAVA